jgi:hypothetical protein
MKGVYIMESKTMEYNGKVMTMEEINKKMEELKVLQALQKEAKKAGLIVKAAKVSEKKEKSANFNLLLAQLAPVVETNKKLIGDLFVEFAGQDSISFDAHKEYHVIIRSKAVVKAKQDARKAKNATPVETLEPVEE